MTYGQVWWPILGIRALHLTHPKCTDTQQWTHREHTPGAVGIHLCCGARGAVGGLVPCSRAPQSWYWGWRERCIHSPHLQFLPARDSNPRPLGYESDSLTIRGSHMHLEWSHMIWGQKMSFRNQYHAKSAVFPPKSSMITNMILILYNSSINKKLILKGLAF